ncbi:MAG: hypothetical protein EOO72_00145 [Myxococcaceae bacterium]|nr:MAG: hypothetical protein EOO72_00145 [Myxococcaceae bacterium]
MNCNAPPAPELSPDLDDATREALRQRAEEVRAKAAALKGEALTRPLAERLQREPGPLPTAEPENRNGVEHARWHAETVTTYGFALGAVVEQDGLGLHNPFGYPARGSTPFSAIVNREVRHARMAATNLWLEAHASASSRRTGKAGGQVLLDEWEECEREDEARALTAAQVLRRRERREGLPAKLLERGLPALAVKVWQEGARETGALRAARQCMAQLDVPSTERRSPFLLLTGVVGTGKTTAAAVALLELAHARLAQEDEAEEHGVRSPRRHHFLPSHPGVPSFAYWSAARLSRRPLFGAEALSEMELAKRVDVLVVDDLGVEFMAENGPWQATLDEVLDARYADAGVTVLTTNLTWDLFSERYGARIADRIRHLGRQVGSGTASLRRPAPSPAQ